MCVSVRACVCVLVCVSVRVCYANISLTLSVALSVCLLGLFVCLLTDDKSSGIQATNASHTHTHSHILTHTYTVSHTHSLSCCCCLSNKRRSRLSVCAGHLHLYATFLDIYVSLRSFAASFSKFTGKLYYFRNSL